MTSPKTLSTSPELVAAIRALVEHESFAASRFGIAVHDVANGDPLYRDNADRIFPAASTTKIPTSIYALALLGPDFRFCTRLVHCGEMVAEGTLQGDLVLIASGDPNLSGRVSPHDTLDFTNIDHSYGGAVAQLVPRNPLQIIERFAQGVHDAGIRRVSGTVLVDVHLFEEGYRETGTFTTVSPIAVNDNQIDLEFTAGSREGDPTSYRLWPRSGYVRFINRAVTANGSSEPALCFSSEQREADGAYAVVVTGTVPAGSVSMAKFAVESPSRFARTLLVEALANAGVVVEGGLLGPSVTARATSADATTLVEHTSPPLKEATKVELKVSQNLHAEMLVRVIGARRGAASGQDAISAGMASGRELLERWGVDLKGAVQADACGAHGHFSPDFMCRLLVRTARSDVYDALLSGFPIMGRDGTLRDMQPESPAAGRVVAKTGTLICRDLLHNTIMFISKALAGYVTAKSGRRVAFCIYLNNYQRACASDPDPSQVVGQLATAVYEHL